MIEHRYGKDHASGLALLVSRTDQKTGKSIDREVGIATTIDTGLVEGQVEALRLNLDMDAGTHPGRNIHALMKGTEQARSQSNVRTVMNTVIRRRTVSGAVVLVALIPIRTQSAERRTGASAYANARSFRDTSRKTVMLTASTADQGLIIKQAMCFSVCHVWTTGQTLKLGLLELVSRVSLWRISFGAGAHPESKLHLPGGGLWSLLLPRTQMILGRKTAFEASLPGAGVNWRNFISIMTR